ncbi:MAG: hypothetical protein Tsb009_36830 [Planctomycetaceae bacterium]
MKGVKAKALRISAIVFAALWNPFTINVIEPKGSGGFALHLVSLWLYIAMFIALVVIAVFSGSRDETRVDRAVGYISVVLVIMWIMLLSKS